MVLLPDSFRSRMQQMLGDEYEAFENSYDKPFHNGLRVNTLKTSPDELKDILALKGERVMWNRNGFYIDDKRPFTSNPLYHAGLYYIQEPSAMLPASVCDIKPGEKVLDICAAPGGKSTAAGAALCGEGLLVSNDISSSRAKALLRNIENFGINNSIVISDFPEKLTGTFQAFFDKIIIDAPCSGEGMFHKEPAMKTSWEKNGPEYYHKIQKDILRCAQSMLKDGGMIIYSTCTFSPLEDEGTVSWFLKEYPQFHVVITDKVRYILEECGADAGVPSWGDGDPQLSGCIRLWPHHIEGEGHFACVLMKDADPVDTYAADSAVSENKKSDKKSGKRRQPLNTKADPGTGVKKKELAPFYDFLESAGILYEFDQSRLLLSGGFLQYVPEGIPDLSGLHLMRTGWYLGIIKKGRFEPSGSFARGLRMADIDERHVIRFDISDYRVTRYLKCETIEADDPADNGWYLICADRFPLGFAKAAGGILKNKYPAGWRMV